MCQAYVMALSLPSPWHCHLHTVKEAEAARSSRSSEQPGKDANRTSLNSLTNPQQYPFFLASSLGFLFGFSDTALDILIESPGHKGIHQELWQDVVAWYGFLSNSS